MEELTNLAVVKEVDRDIQVFLEKAGIVTIKTVADVEKAETIRKEIRVHLKAIDEKLDPFREAAHKAYQGWLTLIKAQKGRLETLEAVLVKSVREWKAEEDRKAQELRAQEAARIDR